MAGFFFSLGRLELLRVFFALEELLIADLSDNITEIDKQDVSNFI